MKRIAIVTGLLILGTTIWADSPWTGTWVLREQRQGSLIMTVEEMGSGLKITYTIVGSNGPAATWSIQTQLDGKDVPTVMNGQPTGQSLATRRLDSRHWFTV